MSAPATNTTSVTPELVKNIDKSASNNKLLLFSSIIILSLYLILSLMSFVPSGKQFWYPDRAAMFVLDTYAYKDHVDFRWDTPQEIRVSHEGSRRFVYEGARIPSWYQDNGASKMVRFDNGGQMQVFEDRVTMENWPGLKDDLIFSINADGKPQVIWANGGSDPMPAWIRQTENKIEVRPTLYERLQIYRKKVEIHRYETGWKYFWFDFNSPLAETSFFGAIGLIFAGERLVPDMSNAALVFQEYWLNEIWLHKEVWIAMLETVFMALIGTMIASAVSLPLAFLAARNIMPFAGVRFALRRFFDLLRGVDMLIWSLVFLRAFGPGMFTGIFAIAFTDTGTFGKLFSEAIENADSKQKEGVQSTGASRLQLQRFGIVPQILPVFISQSLYYLESNTRGAVIIGAMGAGGIGLMFLGYLQTGTSFENVAYISILVLLVVILMDYVSAKLRRALIGIDDKQ